MGNGGVFQEEAVRGSKFFDRCFVAVILLAVVGFAAGVAMALLDHEPRQSRIGLFLNTPR